MQRLHEIGCEEASFNAPYKYDTLTVSLQDGVSQVEWSSFKAEELPRRLASNSLFGECRVTGGNDADGHYVDHRLLQMLVVWRTVPKYNVLRRLPFQDRDTYDKVRRELKLPKAYAYHYARKHACPLVVSSSGRGSGARTNIICQSPKCSEVFLSVALSHDIRKGITRGFMCLQLEADMQNEFKRNLEGLKQFVEQPYLIPAVFYTMADLKHRRKMHQVRRQTEALEDRIAELGRQLTCHSQSKDVAYGKATADYYKFVEQLVQNETTPCPGLVEFANELGQQCLEFVKDHNHHLDEDEDFDEDKPCTRHDLAPCEDDSCPAQELQEYLENHLVGTKAEIHRRELLLARVKQQVDTVNILMSDETMKMSRESTQIAVYGRRYSSAMGAISVLTMLFLPSTAIATIFSMGPFFGEEGNGDLHISDDFWVFLAVAIPFTAVTMIVWALWAQRAEIAEFWQGMFSGHGKQHFDEESLLGKFGDEQEADEMELTPSVTPAASIPLQSPPVGGARGWTEYTDKLGLQNGTTKQKSV